MRYLGLDLGTNTLGIAISDQSNVIASFYKTIRHNENYDFLIKEISDIIKQEQIDKIILGFPKNMNNTIGVKAQLSIDFKEKLISYTNKEVILEDERMTSVIANNVLIMGNVSRKKRKQKVDYVAATIILQSYLDKINFNKGEK